MHLLYMKAFPPGENEAAKNEWTQAGLLKGRAVGQAEGLGSAGPP